MQRCLRSPCLSGHELGIQCVSKPGDNFVLHIEQIGDGLVEPLGPQVIAGLSIDKLHVHPEPLPLRCTEPSRT